MQFTVNQQALEAIQTPVLVIGITRDDQLSGPAAVLDEASDGRITALKDSGDIDARKGKVSWLQQLPGIEAERILVVGMGAAKKLDRPAYLSACDAAGKALRNHPVIKQAVSALHGLALKDSDPSWCLRHSAISLHRANYRYQATKKLSDSAPPALEEIGFHAGDEAILRESRMIGEGYERCRDLGDLPPNLCDPDYLAGVAREIEDAHDRVSVDVLDRERMEALGMGALLAVSAGSAKPPCLIVLSYQGAAEDQAPVALVGKGITFDTGGISLKPREHMDQMKYDMCGAASVLAAFETAVKLELKLNLVTLLAAVENMPDGAAYRPGDVITSMAGKTIEVLNTDAEGRLVLVDALTYCQQTHEPRAMVDVATLTGACVVALGHHASAVMTQDDDIAERLIQAGEQMHDRAWRLPLWDDYQSQLDTPFADMQNVGGMPAGAITAGCFLSRYVEDTPWAHVDIAGTAWQWGKKVSASGRPVGMLVGFLQSLVIDD